MRGFKSVEFVVNKTKVPSTIRDAVNPWLVSMSITPISDGDTYFDSARAILTELG